MQQPEIAWNGFAVLTRQDNEGLREIVKEGALWAVVEHVHENRLFAPGLRVAMPDRTSAPRDWHDDQVAQLVNAFLAERKRRAGSTPG